MNEVELNLISALNNPDDEEENKRGNKFDLEQIKTLSDKYRKLINFHHQSN